MKSTPILTTDSSTLESHPRSRMHSIPSVSGPTLSEAMDGLSNAARLAGASAQTNVFLQAAKGRLFDDPKRYETVADLLELQDGKRTDFRFLPSPEYNLDLSVGGSEADSCAIHTLKIQFKSTDVSHVYTEPVVL